MVKADLPEQTLAHLLLVADDNGAVNRLISLLRQEGLALRPSIATSVRQLGTLLLQEQWDLIVFHDSAGVSLEELLALLRKHEQEVPLILVHADALDDARRVELFRAGVVDAVEAGQTNRLSVSIMREAHGAALRKQFRRLELQHRELEQRHEQLLADSPVAISYLRDGIHLYCNQAYADIFAYRNIETVSTTPLLNLIAAAQRPAMKDVLARAEETPQSGVYLVRKQDGAEEERLLSFSPVEYQGRTCLQMTVQYPRGNAEYSAEVERLGNQDLLTRLDGRNAFLLRVEAAIRAAVQKTEFATLILVELNEFRDIAGAIGRSSSNLVLNDITLCLRGLAGEETSMGRLDEDLFGILLRDGNPDRALALCNDIAEKINNRVSSAMLSSLELSCSVGMALINGHALDAREVLERARLSLRQGIARRMASDNFSIADTLQHDASDMLDYLRDALAERRFRLVFQPIVGISGNNQQCYEVLIRMLDRDGNEILPGAFLPLADLNGMGEQIDRMVVGMALDSLRSSEAVQRLTVNITTNTLMSQTFLPWLSAELNASRIPAERLAIDISEIALHASREQALEFCRGLEVLGPRLTISHFGCALEPYAILDHLKPEFVTLDETVIRDLVYSPQQKDRVQDMLKSLHARKLSVVAPRVEDMALLPILWEVGVDYVQGYGVQAPSGEMNYEFVQDEEITLTAPPQ